MIKEDYPLIGSYDPSENPRVVLKNVKIKFPKATNNQYSDLFRAVPYRGTGGANYMCRVLVKKNTESAKVLEQALAYVEEYHNLKKGEYTNKVYVDCDTEAYKESIKNVQYKNIDNGHYLVTCKASSKCPPVYVLRDKSHVLHSELTDEVIDLFTHLCLVNIQLTMVVRCSSANVVGVTGLFNFVRYMGKPLPETPNDIEKTADPKLFEDEDRIIEDEDGDAPEFELVEETGEAGDAGDTGDIRDVARAEATAEISELL